MKKRWALPGKNNNLALSLHQNETKRVPMDTSIHEGECWENYLAAFGSIEIPVKGCGE